MSKVNDLIKEDLEPDYSDPEWTGQVKKLINLQLTEKQFHILNDWHENLENVIEFVDPDLKQEKSKEINDLGQELWAQYEGYRRALGEPVGGNGNDTE